MGVVSCKCSQMRVYQLRRDPDIIVLMRTPVTLKRASLTIVAWASQIYLD